MSSSRPASQPRALKAPTTAVTLVTSSLLDEVIHAARQSDRRRIILPLHKSADETLHRMFNALQLGTYIQPHRHFLPPKAENILVLRGALCFVTFNEAGDIEQIVDLVANSEVFGVDVAAGVYHTFFTLMPDTVVFEAKPGPYTATDDKDFAAWAPREGDAAAEKYLLMLQQSRETRLQSKPG